MTVLALSLLACTAPPEQETTDEPTAPTLPIVEGVAPAEDVDPDPAVVEVHLTASATNVDWVSGGSTRVWAYNGQVPGPLIQATEGDTLRVVFTNDLAEPTTIHWHGLRIDNAMDGVPAVQDPIQPGETFTYEFVLPDAGSYWYHPHIRGHEQVERGLYGPLVVHERQPPAVAHDRYFVLDDVQLQDNGRFYDFSMSGMNAMHGRQGNVLLTNGSTEVLEGTIERGTLERWRLVNTANARLMYVDITNADWRVVGVDGGILEEPYTTDLLRLPVGRRFDIEVTPRDGEVVKLRSIVPTQDGEQPYMIYRAEITGSSTAEVASVDWPAAVLPVPEEPVQEILVELDAQAGGMMGLRWVINGETYVEGNNIPVEGHTPTLLRVRDLSGAGHPFHLHGQFFEVLSRNGAPSDVPGPLDTIYVGGEDELELYTTFDNPGLWMGHCHILEHAELGMMTTFEVSE